MSHIKDRSRFVCFSFILFLLVLLTGVYVIDVAPLAAQSRQYSSASDNQRSFEFTDSTTSDKSMQAENNQLKPLQPTQNLIYIAVETESSDSSIYRLGGLADPTTVQLNNDIQDSERQTIAVSGNNVFVAWDSDSSEILYRRSIDGGATYGDALILSDDSVNTNSQNPVISVVGSNVFVVWSDSGKILLTKSTDNGISFTQPVLVSNLDRVTAHAVIDMIAVGNVVYVVWSENITGNEGGSEIFFTKSVNGGATFAQKINLSNTAGADSNSPSIGVSGNTVHIVWSDRATESGSGEILYRKSVNGGNTFANAVNLSNTPLSSSNPSIAVFRNNVYVVWEEQQADNFDIMFRKSTNSGVKFDAAMNLSNNPGDSRSAEVAVSQDNVYISWDDRTGKIVGRDVFFIRSDNGGKAFGATTITTSNAGSEDIAVAQNIA